jgi:isopenicillin-N epimerase
VEAVLERITARTRLVLIDHVTSPTALVLPVEPILRVCAERGIDTLIDGAHGPGMLDLSLARLGCAYYTGNLHKWVCAPKGAAFLYVRPDRQDRIRPLTISHGANSPRRDRSRFQLEFDWLGTDDPSAQLCVPHAIRHMGALVPGGWEAVRAHNRALAAEGRALLAEAWKIELPCPAEMLGSMAALILETGRLPAPLEAAPYQDPLERELAERYRIRVPVIPWPDPPMRIVRISAQLYNDREQYSRLAEAVNEIRR